MSDEPLDQGAPGPRRHGATEPPSIFPCSKQPQQRAGE